MNNPIVHSTYDLMLSNQGDKVVSIALEFNYTINEDELYLVYDTFYAMMSEIEHKMGISIQKYKGNE